MSIYSQKEGNGKLVPNHLRFDPDIPSWLMQLTTPIEGKRLSSLIDNCHNCNYDQ